ncbi:MAG: EamA family transporter [Alphaproteobacteria bacterium]|nr:EamA family transporter [Alphaproteobacteria bacterium]
MLYASFPIIAAVCYGLCFAFTQKLLESVNVATYIFLGGVASVFIALGLSKFKHEPISLSFMEDKYLLIVALIAVLVPSIGWLLTMYAIKNISASYAAFAEISYPLFTILFLFLFFGVRHFDWSILVGGGLVMFGSFILIYGQMNTSIN